MKVTDPTGQVWRVSRRWVPWRRRLKGWLGETFGWLSVDADLLGLVLLVVLGVPFAVALVLAVAELALLLVLLPFALLARVLLGRHWTVEARKGFRIWWEEPSGGWRESGDRIAEVAAAVERGCPPAQNVDPPPPASTATRG